MRIIALLAAVVSIQAAAVAAHASAVTGGDPAVSRPAVTVTRDGDLWTADYELDQDASVWAFFRSALINEVRRPWRPELWKVVTPGVVLERIGGRDVLRSLDGAPVPRRVTLTFVPKPYDLEADYGVLAFTDGSVAIPSAQFDIFPLPSVDAAREVPSDLNDVALEGRPALVTWRDRAGPILFRGERLAEATAAEADTYVLFGQAPAVEGERMVTVVDPELPDWIRRAVGDFAPELADVYADRLGPGQTSRPTILLSWSGPTPGRTNMSGSVMPGLIVMRFEGEGVVEPSDEVLGLARWFVGHESAHFWLGQVVRYERARDAWITEGGSNLMAIRALEHTDPAYDALAALQSELDDCISQVDEPVALAGERGEHRAQYACGAVFALIAEAAQRRSSGGDWFDFLRPLLDDNRDDGVLSRHEWLDRLRLVSGDPHLREEIERLLDQGAQDPTNELGALLRRAGVEFVIEAGRLRLS